jgi:ABC-2 type transport system permease protein
MTDLTVPDPIAVGSAARESSRARILDRGYRRYEGRRMGVGGAIRTLSFQTMQRALGIRRSIWAKIFPFFSIFIAYVPAIVFVGMSVLLKDFLDRAIAEGGPNVLPTYGDYYVFVWAAIVVFVGFVAPEVLCTDRRNGLLGLYLASPLSRDTYLVAKAFAVTQAIALVTLGPPLLFLIGLTLNGRGPDGFGGFASVFGRTLVGGVVVALLPVALSFAISSTTTRRAAAGASIIMILLASAIFSESVVESGAGSDYFLLFDLLFLPIELVHRVFGDASSISSSWDSLSTSSLVVAYVAWTAAFALFVRWRYQRIQVTR